MFAQDDEFDPKDQNQKDADLNSEEEEFEDEDHEEDEEDEESDDPDNTSDEDDDKPVTRKELRELLKNNNNNKNAERRKSSKNRDTNKQSLDAKRLETIEKSLSETKLLERKREFGYEHGLSPKQVNHVFRLTKRPTEKFLRISHVKAALDAIKAGENVRANTPSSSGRTFKSSNGKAKDYKDLDPSEKQANFADRRKAILDSKRGQ